MKPKLEKHLEGIKKDFINLADKKYRKGVEEHGGNLPDKEGLIDMAIEEMVDGFIYLTTLRSQIKKSKVKLGKIKE